MKRRLKSPDNYPPPHTHHTHTHTHTHAILPDLCKSLVHKPVFWGALILLTVICGLCFTACSNSTQDTKSYTVTFNANGATGGKAPAAQKVNAGSSITLPSGSGLSKTDYAFGGWNTKADGTGSNYDAGASYTVTGNITLYARWNPAYTVTFDANGATGGTAPPAQTAVAGANITLPSGSELSKTDYTFGGWNTAADGTGTNYDEGASYTVTGTITLYAKWNLIPGTVFTVTFNANGATGGTAPAAQTADAGANITLPAGSGLSKIGYAFGGWNTKADGTGSNYAAGASYTVTGTITLYAKWNTAEPGTVFIGLGDETVDLTKSTTNNISQSQNQVLTVTVTVTDDFDDWYTWYIDGDYRYSDWASSFNVYAGNLSVGLHTLMVVVTKDGIPYSKAVTFRVVY